MSNLTKGDLEILIEAVDYWPNRKAVGELVGEMVSAMLMKDTPEGKEALLKDREEARQKLKQSRKQEEEIATILKAKLILMKGMMESNDETSSFRNQSKML